MKQITFNYLKRILLMFVSVIGFSSMSYAQTDEWEEVFFYDLTSESEVAAGDAFTGAVADLPFFVDNAANWSFQNPYYNMSSVSENSYALTFYKEESGVSGEFFAVKCNVGNGKYRLSMKVANWTWPGETFKLFYCETEPSSGTKVDVSDAFEPSKGTAGAVNTYSSNEFEITNADGGKDLYFGIKPESLPNSKPEILFADIKLEKLNDGGTVEPVPTTYSVTVNPTNCTVSVTDKDGGAIADLTKVAANTMLKVTVTPTDANYTLSSLTYRLGDNGQEQTLANEGTFALTDNAFITAVCNEVVAEASYDDIKKPTVTECPVGDKKTQISGEILNADKLSASSPLKFEPVLNSGSAKDQGWSNADNEILASAGASFDLKVGYSTVGNGSLTIFQLRSDKAEGEEYEMLGQYLGDWGVLNNNDLFASLSGAKDGSNGFITEVVDTENENNATFHITVPADINVGELVVVRFLSCKIYSAGENNTPMDQCTLVYNDDPYVTDATELNYCDYVIRIVDENYEEYTVTINEPQNGTLTVMNGNVAVKSGDKVEKGKTLTITAKADEGYALKEVVANEAPLTSVQGTYHVEVSGNTEISATFEKLAVTYQITVEKPANGNLSIDYETADGTKNINTSDFEDASQTFDIEENTVLSITVTPATDYELDAIYPEGMTEKSELKYEYTVAGTATIRAEFKAVKYASVVIGEYDENMGTITVEAYDEASEEWSDASSMLAKVQFGTQLRFIVEAAEGYMVESVKNGDVAMTANTEDGYYYLTVEAETITISATFSKDPSSIGEVSGNPVYYDSSEELLYTSAAKDVKVYDLSGRLVLSVENEDVVNVSGLTDGVYTAVVDGTALKFVK